MVLLGVALGVPDVELPDPLGADGAVAFGEFTVCTETQGSPET